MAIPVVASYTPSQPGFVSARYNSFSTKTNLNPPQGARPLIKDVLIVAPVVASYVPMKPALGQVEALATYSMFPDTAKPSGVCVSPDTSGTETGAPVVASYLFT